jgi:hypothetical protein
MGLWARINSRAGKLDIIDVILIQIATVCFTVLVIKFAPKIIIISKWWFIVIFLVSLVRPFYAFWLKK